jgi:hypothetical protein
VGCSTPVADALLLLRALATLRRAASGKPSGELPPAIRTPLAKADDNPAIQARWRKQHLME